VSSLPTERYIDKVGCEYVGLGMMQLGGLLAFDVQYTQKFGASYSKDTRKTRIE